MNESTYVSDKILYKRIEIKKFIFVLLLFIQVFEYALFMASPAFKSIDEAISAISMIYLFLTVTTTRSIFLKYEIKFIVYLTFVVIIGIVSGIIFKYQPLSSAVSDIIIFSKFIFGYFLSRFLLRNIHLDTLKRTVIKICRASAVFLCTVLVINIFTNILPHFYEFRFFTYAQPLFFGHPTYMGSTCVAIMTLLMGFREEGKSNTAYILMCMLVAFFSLRFKILVFLGFFVVFMYYEARKRQIGKIIIVVIAVAGIAFSYQQINYYYLENTDFARSALTLTSYKIANDHFPFGSGFAAFGSYQSGVNYSPIYHKYGIDHIWGITRKEAFFISDNFWPMILGQFGYIGLIFFILFILSLISLINRLKIISYSYYYSALSCIVYLLISSTSESSFVQPFAVLFLYITGAFVSQLVAKQDKSLCKGEVKNESIADKQILFYKGRKRDVFLRDKKPFGTEWP